MITLWVVVIVAALASLWARPIATNTVAGGAVTVAPQSTSSSPTDAGALPTDAAAGTDLQGAALPADVVSKIIQ